MIQIQVAGLHELNGFLRGLPKNLNREIGKESANFMRDIQKSARLRAPKDTRGLRESIHVELTGKSEWTLFVDSPHGVYQEEGFRPHWIHSSMIKSSNKLGGEGFFFVSKSTPFVRPALEHNLSKLAQRMGDATQRAIMKK